MFGVGDFPAGARGVRAGSALAAMRALLRVRPIRSIADARHPVVDAYTSLANETVTLSRATAGITSSPAPTASSSSASCACWIAKFASETPSPDLFALESVEARQRRREAFRYAEMNSRQVLRVPCWQERPSSQQMSQNMTVTCGARQRPLLAACGWRSRTVPAGVLSRRL